MLHFGYKKQESPAVCNGSGKLVIGVADCYIRSVIAKQLSTDPYTYNSLSSELLNCKITDTLNNMTHTRKVL